MSDRMPVMDLIGDEALGAGPWACPRCGRENKASWRACPGCESDRDGVMPTTTRQQPRQISALGVVLGLVILIAVVVAAVMLAEPVWAWAVEQWTALVAWVDART